MDGIGLVDRKWFRLEIVSFSTRCFALCDKSDVYVKAPDRSKCRSDLNIPPIEKVAQSLILSRPLIERRQSFVGRHLEGQRIQLEAAFPASAPSIGGGR